MDELTSGAVRAVSVGTVLLAKLGLVENRNICLYHHVVLAMGK